MTWLIAFILQFALVDFKLPSPEASLSFPRDHGSHDGFETEWWYLTGHLGKCQSKPTFLDSTDFGFQLTFFRRSRLVTADKIADGFLAHAAISDVREQLFFHEARSAAVGASLAGAAAERLDVWNHEWFLRQQGDRLVGELRLENRGVLRLIAPIPAPVLQGRGGFSKKGECQSCSSHYYSLPRLELQAEIIREDGSAAKLCGLGWLDHEWMSSALEPAQTGWDWLSLMCKDGRNVMAFTVRGSEPFSGWSVNDTRGESHSSVFSPSKFWKSPTSDGSYPTWTKIAIPGFAADIAPLIPGQEISGSGGISYWEGAVRSADDCLGYLELTGYAGQKPKI